MQDINFHASFFADCTRGYIAKVVVLGSLLLGLFFYCSLHSKRAQLKLCENCTSLFLKSLVVLHSMQSQE